MGMPVHIDTDHPGGTVRGTAGSFAISQTGVSTNGRIQCPSSASVTVPLFTVPTSSTNINGQTVPGKSWYQTDYKVMSTSTVELNVQLAYQVTVNGVTVTCIMDRGNVTSTCGMEGSIETQDEAPPGSSVVLIFTTTAATTAYVDYCFAGFLQGN